MADPYLGMADTTQSPASHLAAIVPSDTVSLPTAGKGLYVGGAGNVALVGVGDSAPVIFVGVPAGTILPVRVKQVMATGTTATNLVALI